MGGSNNPSVIDDSGSTKVVILVIKSKVENKIVVNLISVLSQSKWILLLFDCRILLNFFCGNVIFLELTLCILRQFLSINFCQQFESSTVKVIFLVVCVGLAANSLLLLCRNFGFKYCNISVSIYIKLRRYLVGPGN